MKREIISARNFAKEIDYLLKKRLLLHEDFDDFKKELSKNLEMGDLIVGAGGVRKVRLKSASGGKSGGFRVCYYDLASEELLYLLWIYSKKDQENLTADEKKMLKEFVKFLKG